jgi:hypothetical protein
MHKLFAALLLLSLLAPSGCEKGKTTTRPPAVPGKPGPADTKKPGKPVPSPKPSPRIFGQRATPAPAPAPEPMVRQNPKPKPKPKTTSTGEPAEPVVKEVPKVAQQETPGDSVKGTAPVVTPPPKSKTGKGSTKGNTSTGGSTAGTDERTRFRNAKAQAQEDGHLKELRSKADGEVNEAEANKALKEYNKALFQKIREVDPSVSGYSGKVEQSMSKRLSNEKAKE